MNSTQAPNHPVTFSSHLEPLAEVSHVSITNGHQIGKFKPTGTNLSSPVGGDSKKKLTKFSPKAVLRGPASDGSPSAGTSKNGAVPLACRPAKPLTPTRQDPITTSTKGKEKAVAPSDDEEEDLFNDDPDHDVEQDVKPSSPPPAGPKRGRPRKSILQDAAKSMKKF
ncbi:hypothetical protein PtA15_4A526 [Puccinia triticina]|uniref:Uncharacterized protein n=1 Tax=Puccinia triticina TaxID=208348 RepID=A0ABY7CH41_9BASI|nr:uncharacterized protein PtA15_4A526 [Puccinia triticina]WAQ84075.1 hypothetical protein PtA15_4A526 [Puccinia triticina]